MNNQKIHNTSLSIMIALAIAGISSSARASVPVPICGNGIEEAGEECDDGNVEDGDGCSAECEEEKAPCCGDGELDPGEACDDGNVEDGDGCSAECEEEKAPCCGDGELDPGEECDDGNVEDGDGCSAECEEEKAPCCGDGELDPGEACDDGNVEDGDGCSAECEIERIPCCGDGELDPGEECDDGNTANGDGCDEWCNLESCRGDEDEDGVNDCDDQCPGTSIPEDVPTVELLPNHYALVTNDGIFDTVDPKTKVMEDSEYTIGQTGGCSCEQILDAKPGNNEGLYKYGCSNGIIKGWIDDQSMELGEADPEPQVKGCNLGQTRHAPAWAFLGLMFAMVGLRRRT